MPAGKLRKFVAKPRTIKSIVQKQINKNVETKSVTKSYNEEAVQDQARTPIDYSLTEIAQGDTKATRNGNQYLVQSIKADLWVKVADTTNIVRVVWYIPKISSETMTSNTISVYSAIDYDTFTVLSDRRYLLHGSLGPGFLKCRFSKRFNSKSRRGLKVLFNGTAATDIVKNNIRLYVVSDSAAATDPTISGNIKMFFKDA